VQTLAKLRLWDGVRAFFGGVGFVVGKPGVWGYALVPATVALFLGGVLGSLGIWGASALATALVAGESAWATAGQWLVGILLGVLAVVLAFLVAVSLAQPLSGFALEAIVRKQEKGLGVEHVWPEQPFWPSLARSLRVTLMALVLGLPVIALLTLVELVFAPAAVITWPLKFVVSALMLAWDFLDYPLGMRGLGVRDRLRFFAHNLGPVTVFGCLATVVLLVPGLGLLVLPMGAAGAARLVVGSELQGGPWTPLAPAHEPPRLR
jgi:CysZ protein